MKLLSGSYKQWKLGLKQLTICFIALLVASTLNAQEEETVDTLVMFTPDTVVSEAPVVTAEPAYDEEVEIAAGPKVYFKHKSLMNYGVTDSFHFYHIRPDEISNMKKDEDFWYADRDFRKKKADQYRMRNGNKSQPISQHPAFQFILWVLIIGGFLAFLVIYLMNSNVNLFRSTNTIKTDSGEELVTDDIFSISYSKEIEKATAAGNYRLATRLLFLKLIRDLSLKSLIEYKQDSTNFDYMVQLRSSSIYPDFFQVSRHYEYTWYGQFPVDSAKFEIIRKEFASIDQKLNY